MARVPLLLALLLLIWWHSSPAQQRFRVVIMTDMTHDDGNSLIRYLHYAHLFDTEAIIVTPQLPDYPFDSQEPWKKAGRILRAYEDDLPLLRRHQSDFPSSESLYAVTKRGEGALPIIWLTNEKTFSGQIGNRQVTSEWGDIRFEDWIGDGTNPNGRSKDSEGSEFLQEVFDQDDDRPIFVQMWGGPITFVQALYRYRQRKGEAKFQALLSKLHIYGILLQDITFDFFVDLDKVKALDCTNFGSTTSSYEGKRAHPGWLLHDGGHFWQYCCSSDPDFEKPMLPEEVNGHGSLSELYDAGGEGDTPAFLYLLSAQMGLNDPLNPDQGSWGGRFQPMGAGFPEGYFHTCGVDVQELLRWKQAVKNDFAHRLDWTTAPPEAVNHAPVARLKGYSPYGVHEVKLKAGQRLRLHAKPSSDPDGDSLTFQWFWYEEVSEYPGTLPLLQAGAKQVVRMPNDWKGEPVHLLLQVQDAGTPPLVSYQRIILKGR